MKQKLFIFFTFLFFIAGLYHAVALFVKLNDAPAWRNALFVFINAIGIYGVLKRPKYFLHFFFFWMIQQLYSHGCAAFNTWTQLHTVDWISIAVIITMPTVFAFLLLDKAKKEKPY